MHIPRALAGNERHHEGVKINSLQIPFPCYRGMRRPVISRAVFISYDQAVYRKILVNAFSVSAANASDTLLTETFFL